MRVLSAADVARLLPVADAVPLMSEAFRALSSGQGSYPVRTHLLLLDPPGDGLAMPAYDGGSGLGVKLVTVHPGNAALGRPVVHALYLLVRATDGEPLMLCEGGALTAIRTGAGTGAAVDVLARPDSRRMALFGAGVQARTQLLAVLAVRPIERVAVYARNREKVRAFCAELGAHVAARLEPASSPDEAVRDADIVVTATTAREPVFDGRLLKPGAHVSAVGAYRLDMREVDTLTVQRARVFVDARDAATAEAGDIVIPLRDGAITTAHVCGELGEVLLGRVPGRTAPDDITFFKSVGSSVQDVVAARELYRRAEREDAGTRVAL